MARGGTVRSGMATGGTMTVRSGTARQKRQEAAWQDGGMTRRRHSKTAAWRDGGMAARGGTATGGTTNGGTTTARGGTAG